LRDLLHQMGVTEENKHGAQYVHFYAVDSPFVSSIPIKKALDFDGDTIIAYEMNGEPLNRDHGYPLRVITPGYAGVRNVKWVEKIVVSGEDAPGAWTTGMSYKYFAPWIKDLKGVAIEKQPSVYDMPVQSAICDVNRGVVTRDDEEVVVRGFAWSGGGRKIVDVGVSIDGGKTWQSAEMGRGSEQESGKAWAWTFWSANLNVPRHLRDGDGLEIVCRAVDSSFNSQPERKDMVWNIRGILNNSWHRVTIPFEE
jgi:sulfite oxidase